SIETLLHACLPAPYVEHTHADAILAVTNTVNGEAIAARLFGSRAPCVPFRQSGFELAKTSIACFDRDARADTIGLILLQHGVFAFGQDARQSYERMLRLVHDAEQYLAAHGAWTLPRATQPAQWSPEQVVNLRREACLAAGFCLLASVHDDAETLAFARRDDLTTILEQGPATPHHAVFIKRLPLVGRHLRSYVRDYLSYVDDAHDAPDPAPRVILDPDMGALVLGYGPDYLRMTEDIFLHGRQIMTRASAHDRYRGLPAAAILEAEIHYGGFERRIRHVNAPRDTLRGQCIGIGIGDARFAAALASGLSERGAACLDARDAPTPVDVARRYGGMDAVIFDSSHFGWVDSLRPILQLAPFGARALCVDATPVRGTELSTIAVGRDLPAIMETLSS
ncbi:MAG: hypothetical protein FJY37_20505, partial [Betaproteobacteria bacterium]|nr:hypothetical protein [Betaproteobacteria bacterium]